MIQPPIHQHLIDNLSLISKQGFVKSVLRDYNLHNIFSPIYENVDNPDNANFLSVFLILAYSNKCKWLYDFNKDRRTLKLEIITSILLDSKIKVTDEIEMMALKSNADFFEVVLNDYLNYQKDRNFIRYISLSETISATNRKGMVNSNIKYNELNSLVKTTNDIKDTEKQLDEIRMRIEEEYTTLDEALKKEGRKPISRDYNIEDYEARMINSWQTQETS